jgi:hypothetical protein
MTFATYRPCCFAAGATPGTRRPSGSVKLAASPMTNTFSPVDKSGCTSTRPARSVGAPSQRPAAEAATPAAQMTVALSRRSAPIETPISSHAVTVELNRTSTPSLASERSA